MRYEQPQPTPRWYPIWIALLVLVLWILGLISTGHSQAVFDEGIDTGERAARLEKDVSQDAATALKASLATNTFTGLQTMAGASLTANISMNGYWLSRDGTAAGLFLSSANEVLIATSTDAGDFKLQVNGTSRFNGTISLMYPGYVLLKTTDGAGTAGSMAVGSGNEVYIGASVETLYISSASGYPIIFRTGSTARGRFLSSGELLLGTAGSTDNGTYSMQLTGNQYTSGRSVIASTTDDGVNAFQCYDVASISSLKISNTTELNGVASAVKVLGNPSNTTPSCASGQAGLSVWNGGISMILGADNAANTRTNNTTKAARLGTAHYANGEEPVTAFLSTNIVNENKLMIGGGSSVMNAVNLIQFFAAATGNVTTVTGTQKMQIDLSGVSIATNTPMTGYDLTVGSGAYFAGAVNCSEVIDHSAAPDTLAEAMEIIESHESLNGRIDHSKLSPLAWGTKHVKRATGRMITKEIQVEEAIPPEEIEPVEEGKEPITTRTVTKTIEEPEYETISKPDSESRNMSMCLSAAMMKIADLEKRLRDLEAAH